MSDAALYRVTDYVSGTPKHAASLITDGSKATIVYPGEVQESTDSESGLFRIVEQVGAPDSQEGWARLVSGMSSYYSVSPVEVEKSSDFTSLVESEIQLLDRQSVDVVNQERQTDLANKIEDLTLADPDLAEFLSTGSADTPPEGFRDFMRLVLESYDAMDLNPGIKDWLDGGDPPEDFDGFIFFKSEEDQMTKDEQNG